MCSVHSASPLQHKLFEARQEPVVVVGGHSLDSHPPGSSVYLAGFALLQLLSILHDNALATAPPENPPSRLYLELARSPVITRDRPRLLEITRDYPRPLEITRDQPRSSEITRDHSRSPEINRDHPRLPETTRDHPRDQAGAHELPLLAAPPPPTPLRAGALGSTAAIVPLPGAAAAVLRPGRTVSRGRPL